MQVQLNPTAGTRHNFGFFKEKNSDQMTVPGVSDFAWKGAKLLQRGRISKRATGWNDTSEFGPETQLIQMPAGHFAFLLAWDG